MKNRIAAIDVGTTKIVTLMCSVDSTQALRVLGIGTAVSRGMEKGLISNTNEVRDTIRQSVKNAETMAGYRLKTAYVSVNGKHVSSTSHRGTIAITHADQMVRIDDLRRVLDVALDVKTPADRKLLHVIPRRYTLDGSWAQSPTGMHGNELNAEIDVISAGTVPVESLTRCVNAAGIDVDGLILAPLASAQAVVNEEEKQSGVLVADIGGGTTGIVILKEGNVYRTSVLPIGGYQITNDIVIGLGLSYALAEEMKKKYGGVTPVPENRERDETINEDGHSIPRREMVDILRSRVEELFRLIMLELPRTEYAKLVPSGIIITGGCANLSGITELATEVTRLPVRIGTPPKLVGVSALELDNPAFATSVGMLMWQMENEGANKTTASAGGIRGLFRQVFGASGSRS
jgi:cell division protein FtsA